MASQDDTTRYPFITAGVRWLLLSLLSAVLLILTFPEPGLSFFAWVALVPFFLVIMTSNFKKTILSALVTGVLFNTVYLYWMKEYKHPLALSGGVFGEMVYWLAAVMISYFLFHNLPAKRSPWRSLNVVALAFGWFTIDYVKTIGFLAFPWGILGYSQYENLVLIQSASMFGVWGINFIILYCNTALAAFILVWKVRERGSAAALLQPSVHLFIVLALLLSSVGWGILKLKEEEETSYTRKRVALVQANFDPWSPQLNKNILLEMELTRHALKSEPDLVVWSESSVPFLYEYYLNRENPHALRVHEFATSLHRPFIFGTLEFDGMEVDGVREGNYYNIAAYYNGGVFQGTYRKIHLVPFGEWFPYKRLFPFVVTILREAGAGDFTPGDRHEVFQDSGFRFNALICFEDVFGNLARKFVLRGSQLLINVTNDAWTGSERAEVQHYSLSVFRTIENRRSMVRAANGGVTVCVNPYGRPLAKLDLFTADVLVCDVDIVDSSVITFYTAYGEVLPLIILPLSLLGALALMVKKFIDIISA
jgi:apolipoprotein N-acyltransferase